MPDDLTPAPDVIAAYVWEMVGPCFRCSRTGIETAEVGQLPHRGIRACATCVLVIERERQRAATRYGWPYQPGTPPPHWAPQIGRWP